MNDKTRLIGIFYIVFGAMGILGLPVIYLQQRVMNMVFANMGEIGAEAQPIMDLFHDLMEILMPALMVLIIAHIVFNVLVGICFIKHKFYYTCLITSIFTCLVFPIGTILGVFSLMTLIDEDVKKLFYISKLSS
jgi:hypothetical protein